MVNNLIINGKNIKQYVFNVPSKSLNRFSIKDNIFNYFALPDMLLEDDENFFAELNKNNGFITVDNVDRQIDRFHITL